MVVLPPWVMSVNQGQVRRHRRDGGIDSGQMSPQGINSFRLPPTLYSSAPEPCLPLFNVGITGWYWPFHGGTGPAPTTTHCCASLPMPVQKGEVNHGSRPTLPTSGALQGARQTSLK